MRPLHESHFTLMPRYTPRARRKRTQSAIYMYKLPFWASAFLGARSTTSKAA